MGSNGPSPRLIAVYPPPVLHLRGRFGNDIGFFETLADYLQHGNRHVLVGMGLPSGQFTYFRLCRWRFHWICLSNDIYEYVKLHH